MKTSTILRTKRGKRIRLGFVPLVDAAPLIVAHELGYFEKFGLSVTLERVVGWASVRDKIVFGELDAAHALAALPFATTLGLGCIPEPCSAALVLNLHGNAITLSNELRQQGVTDAPSLRREIERLRGQRMLTFGIVFPFSSHHFLLRQWLVSGGINPDRDVRLVVVPPVSMVTNLKTGNLDGFCVGEPWNSRAIEAGFGWCAATTAQLSPQHPEKVLMTTHAFTETHTEEHRALIAALLEACAWCQAGANREALAHLLSTSGYISAPVETLRRSLQGPFEMGFDRKIPAAEFHVFHGPEVNEPGPDKAGWIMDQLFRSRLVEHSAATVQTLRQVFRPDLFADAQTLTASVTHDEKHTSHELVSA